MKKEYLHIARILGLLFLLIACKENDDYRYPSVSLDFVTVKAGEDGRLQILIPDKGSPMPVLKDRTNTKIAPYAFKRMLSNYEVTVADGTPSVTIYSLQELLTPEPKLPEDPAYADGIKTDPVTMVSIWMGRDYLNMILNLKVKGGKKHVFGMVEESIVEKGNEKVVTLSLFHDAAGDEPYYDRRAYISIPLQKYKSNRPEQVVRIKFKYHTYDKDGNIVESDRYCQPGFEYISGSN
ncbi:NigD1/NigD2 family lipoprotein [Bacteroides pyogenes]|uniref:NigD1/NigD2 family lipoprotein n=1 Tax=Bacteroides pyogenes TaxID=310300 RepID=UPI0003DD911B|nr:NigD-like C-terminal domain-containing protein [Bacteroides pyogenes]MBB3895329.1 hypothetical protein [Bacteroides pyogenes]GAE22396.1 hypothetical protein JCM10003_1987 [Bacteroides pyogenes JCM 10003]SUV70683.1 NigD-like protein [Bacteroides pyogenes]